MKTKRSSLIGFIALIAISLMLSGCAVNLYRQSPRSKEKIKKLKAEISTLEKERRKEQKELKEAKRALERKLKDQIARDQVSLEVGDRGLVIILSDDILFDSGKAEIKKEAFSTLDKVASIIKNKVPDKNIGIAGHTDNVPITYSNWDSNWELSVARATNVLHYMDKKGIPAERLSATGYGEHHPIASNDTEIGRARNRRVEIVILPEFSETKQEEVSEETEEELIK